MASPTGIPGTMGANESTNSARVRVYLFQVNGIRSGTMLSELTEALQNSHDEFLVFKGDAGGWMLLAEHEDFSARNFDSSGGLMVNGDRVTLVLTRAVNTGRMADLGPAYFPVMEFVLRLELRKAHEELAWIEEQIAINDALLAELDAEIESQNSAPGA